MLAGRGGPRLLLTCRGGVAISRVSDCARAPATSGAGPAALLACTGGDDTGAAASPSGCFVCPGKECPLRAWAPFWSAHAPTVAPAVALGGLRWAAGESKDTVRVIAATSARLWKLVVRPPSDSYSVGGSVSSKLQLESCKTLSLCPAEPLADGTPNSICRKQVCWLPVSKRRHRRYLSMHTHPHPARVRSRGTHSSRCRPPAPAPPTPGGCWAAARARC